MTFEMNPKRGHFDGQCKMNESSIHKILNDYMQIGNNDSSQNFMSRRPSHTYDITVNKENLYSEQTLKRTINKKNVADYSQRISTFQNIYDTAVSEYNQAYEQGQMLIEDLNAKLLQRAENISQREDMELLLDKQMQDNNVEYDYALDLEEISTKQKYQIQKINDLTKTLEQLTTQKQIITQQQITDKLSFKYVEITNQIQRTQNKIAIEQKIINQLISQHDDIKTRLKKNVLDSTKQAFQEYLYNQQDTFVKLKECYGPQLYNQILTEHRQQLESLLNSQFSKKIQSIQQMHRQQNKIQKQIDRNINFVDNNLSIDIENIRQTIDLKRDVMHQLKQTLQQQSVPKIEVNQLKRKVETLEIEKLQLEQQVIQMSLRMENQSKRYNQSSQQGMRTAEKLYGEILGVNTTNKFIDFQKSPVDFQKSPITLKQRSSHKSSSSQKKKRSYSEINQNRQLQKTQKSLDRFNDSNTQSESLVLSQMYTIHNIISHDLSNLRASDSLERGQLSVDDSFMQHIQDLNISIQQQSLQKDPRKTLNMPLQQISKQIQLSHEDDVNERLHTIAEEQLSTNRLEEEQRFKFKIHSQQLSNITIEDSSNTTKKNQFIMTLTQPTTNKANRNFNFIKKDALLSDQVMKTKKSKSVDLGSQLFNLTQKQEKVQQFPIKSNLTPLEKDVLRTVQPLMSAMEVYKKFSNQPQFKKEEYNPFQQHNPLAFGYGVRFMLLSQNLDSIEFRNPLKPQIVESIIKIDHIIRPVIICLPQQIKYQRPNDYLQMALIVQKQGKIELLMPGELSLQQWFQGILFLKDNQRTLISIKKKINLL